MSTVGGAAVISLTRLDGQDVVVNADHVLTVEATPDTMLVLTTGLHLKVRESVRDVVERAAAWRRRTGVAPRVLVPVRDCED
jgi:flagellar protein FlbD